MVVEYLPASQSVHTVAPTVVEYLPASQLVQVSFEIAPTIAEYVPAGQLMHTVAPTVVEYWPALHVMQVSAKEAPRVAENLPIGHIVQVLMLLLHAYIFFLQLPAEVEVRLFVQPDRHPPRSREGFSRCQDNRC
jgi:hypothetical protein